MMSEALELTDDAPRDAEAGAWNWTADRLVCLPSDVQSAKAEIDALVTSVTGDVAACPNLTDADRQSWEAFRVSWRQFYCRDTSGTCTSPDYTILGLCDQLNDCDRWRAATFDRQVLISKACKMSAPVGPPAPPPNPIASSAELVKWLTIAGLVFGGLYVAHQVGLPRLFPKGGK